MYDSLISPKIVEENLTTENWRFFDCRFVLNNPQQKQSEFRISHLPKASYVNLEKDLSDPHIIGKTGRHPLPDEEKLSKKFSLWGIDSSVQVVVYDDFGGAHAARLWWILRWLGHDKVAVIDGGWQRWIKENRPISKENFSPKSRLFKARPRDNLHVSSKNVLNYCLDNEIQVLDARSQERFRGENESMDPVAGHIPSAISAPYNKNLDEEGNWKSKSELRKMYLEILNGSPAEKAVVYCGSGITACHNILAIYHAGLGLSRIYPGSWSDWINDPRRPVAVGQK